MRFWQQLLSSTKRIVMFALYYAALAFMLWWILGGIWWYWHVGPLDFYKRNAFMAVRQKGMIWTFVILGLVKIAALLGRGLFSKDVEDGSVRRFLIMLNVILDLAPIPSFASLIPKPCKTVHENYNVDSVSVISNMRERPFGVRRARSESDLTTRATQSTDDRHHHSHDGTVTCAQAEEAALARKRYNDLQNIHLDLMARFGRSEENGREAGKEIVRCRKGRAQLDEKNKQLAIQYSSLCQKYYSGRQFAAQPPIWLLIRVPELRKDDDETISPSLTEFEYSSTQIRISLTCRPAQNVLRSTLTPEEFKIDHYFGPLSTNQDVYNEVEPLMSIVFHGCNVCIFTDGQSGSGKSWTMFKGPDALAPSIAASVFAWKDTELAGEWKRDVKCSAIEVYRDRLKDLLAIETISGEEKVEIMKAKRGDYDRPVLSVKALIDLLEEARAKLRISATHENKESSRGHFFCSLVLTQSSSDKPSVKSRITLIDLAGGERMADPCHALEIKARPSQIVGSKSRSSSPAARAKVKPSCTPETEVEASLAAAETAAINSSRGDLRTLLIELMNGKSGAAVSEFTKYLKFILGNQPRLIYLAHLSPLFIHYGRTLDTLKFAKELRCKS